MIEKIQKELKKQKLDGWLIYDFHRTNSLAVHFLKIPNHCMATRRMFYWIPVKGHPVKILHKIEPSLLDHWEGKTMLYFSFLELQRILSQVLSSREEIAMEVSEDGKNPYISKVDAGTFHLIQRLGVTIKSSSNLFSRLSILTEEQIASHIEATQFLDQTAKKTWKWIVERFEKKRKTKEKDVQQFIYEQFEKHGFTTEGFPICAVDENSANPHYAPISGKDKEIRKGSLILIDLWCKQNHSGSVFGDITRMAVLDSQIQPEIKKVYQIVREAQKRSVEYIRENLQKKKVSGAEVDLVARNFIEQEGYGPFFLHRLGHSIDQELHGKGVHLDSQEVMDERELVPSTCCSIEPGIYLENKFGVREEHDLIITEDLEVVITGGEIDELPTLL